jgi:fructose-1,6-bisphosphatase/inositol monophosphatase family enzyme
MEKKMNRKTRDGIIQKSSWSKREKLLVDIMEQVGQMLLANRNDYLAELKNRGPHKVIYSDTHKVDQEITSFIKRQLELNEETGQDNIILEDDDTECDLIVDQVTWIGDAVDNTKAYLEGGDLFGSGLMAVAPNGNVLASLFILPAKKKEYLAIPGKGSWCNGNQMALGAVESERPVAIIRWPRDRDKVDMAIRQVYKTIEEEFRQAGYLVQPGQVLTAADVLAIAESGPVAKIVCYTKPWDFLIAVAIAFTNGAIVQWFDKSSGEIWRNVFPLNHKLLNMANRKERVLFRAERKPKTPGT